MQQGCGCVIVVAMVAHTEDEGCGHSLLTGAVEASHTDPPPENLTDGYSITTH